MALMTILVVLTLTIVSCVGSTYRPGCGGPGSTRGWQR